MSQDKPLPEGTKFREQWAELDRTGRRRVRSASNRGRPVATRKEAGMAAAMAAKQQRLWRWAWLLGPVGLAMMRIPDGVAFMFINFVMGYAVFLPMAWYFRRRAADAERINREIYNGHRRPDKHGKAPRPGWTLKMLKRDKRT